MVVFKERGGGFTVVLDEVVAVVAGVVGVVLVEVTSLTFARLESIVMEAVVMLFDSTLLLFRVAFVDLFVVVEVVVSVSILLVLDSLLMSTTIILSSCLLWITVVERVLVLAVGAAEVALEAVLVAGTVVVEL